MCQSMVNIQSPTSEIRRGKKKEEEEEEEERNNMKIYMVSLLHRATIKNGPVIKSVKISPVKRSSFTRRK